MLFLATNVNQIMDENRQFVVDNLEAMAKEILDWRNTGNLKPKGLVEKVALRLKTGLGIFDGRSLTECMVSSAALERVATKE